MSDIFDISVTALRAFQQAINVTSNNVANASTPGYDRERLTLTELPPQSSGQLNVGSGVSATGITRSYSQQLATQLQNSQSSLGSLTAVQSYATQIDNLFGTTIGGLSTSIQNYYGAWSAVANNPTSTAARQSLLSAAQGVATSFNNASGNLDSLNADLNNKISADVTQVNSYGKAIANLNAQISVATGQAGGQPPNELLDQRDQAISDLSKLVGVQTSQESDGSVNVFIGNGVPLVLQQNTTLLTTVPNQFNATQLEVGSTTSTGPISSSITSGDLGGLLQARTQVIQPTTNSLGQIATALSTQVNTQQASGLDLAGNPGAPIFSVGTPAATASVNNTDAVTASVTVAPADVGALTADTYVLTNKGGNLLLNNALTGASVAYTGTGTAADPIKVNGATIVLSGAPAVGDQFLIQPTATASDGIKVVLNDPTKVAAAGAVVGSAATTNAGTGQISAGTVLDPTNANLLTSASIAFTSPTTYTINGGATQTLAANGTIDANGWEVQITGAPAAGDSFTVQRNTGATGDNRNALAASNQQNSGILGGGVTSVTAAISGLITGLGSQTAQINTAQQAQVAVTTQVQNSERSANGVNLDEEAADLLKWQQAYQASAQALQIGSSLFQTLIQSRQKHLKEDQYMRVTQGSGQAQFLAAVQQLESSLQTTQNHLDSNQSFTTAAENPIGAGQVNGYNQALAQSQQYSTNASSAQSNLQTEDNALSQVTSALQSLRSLTLQANGGTLSADNKRSIASQLQQIQQTLVGLANTQNGQGEYIFAGYATQTKPFSLTTTGASYAGDANQRQIQIAAGQTVADGDTGATVFNNIKTGNGTFQVTAGAANTGSGLIGASTVTDQTAYDGGAYTISFPTPATYQVTDAANNVVSTGAYADGDSIAFKGIQVTLTGTPAANDSFSVAPSKNQDIFTTVQNLITGLSAANNSPASANQLGNLAASSLGNIDQALNNIASVRATVGGRVNTITAQQTVATSQQTQLKTNIANLQGLDYAAAITDLTQQNTTLQAALSAYTMTQGLSLFKYIQ